MNTYIKMCEKSEEIQKWYFDSEYERLKSNWLWEYDIFVCKEHRTIFRFHQKDVCPAVKGNLCNRRNNKIWIPTEERLQEIAMKLPSLQGRVMQPFWELVDQFNYFIFGDETRKYVSQFNSFKEFWFAFIMKGKYHKMWDGKTWIKDT